MADNILTRIGKAWNAFFNKEDPYTTEIGQGGFSGSGGRRPDRGKSRLNRDISASIYTRMAIDVANLTMLHVMVDENGRYISTRDSGLNECLTVQANIDQSGTAFLQDVAMSLFDEGAIALVPVDTDYDPTNSGQWDVDTVRVGSIKEWYPSKVKVDVYNDHTGNHQEIILPKTTAAVVENPLYNIMNEPNSTLKRLLRKLTLLDVIDEQSSSGKLDLIIQLPFLIKNEARKAKAEERRKDIEDQLRGSEYGIAYTDGTEKIIQLNRPTENNLMAQIEYLTSMLYSQLGLTTTVMDGTADEATMINYYKRTIEPVANAIADAITRTFISKTARSQGQKIMTFSDPFKLVPTSVLAEMVDKFTRNEILTSNEIRGIIGFKPSNQKNADELRNKNLTNADIAAPVPSPAPTLDLNTEPVPSSGQTTTD